MRYWIPLYDSRELLFLKWLSKPRWLRKPIPQRDKTSILSLAHIPFASRTCKKDSCKVERMKILWLCSSTETSHVQFNEDCLFRTFVVLFWRKTSYLNIKQHTCSKRMLLVNFCVVMPRFLTIQYPTMSIIIAIMRKMCVPIASHRKKWNLRVP